MVTKLFDSTTDNVVVADKLKTPGFMRQPDVIVRENQASADRIWFIQLLRAVAILLVVFGHVLLNFWCANQLYSTTLRIAPLQNLVVPDYLVKICLLVQSYQLHPELIGVGVFFLVSGFVIPISVERYGPPRFIVLRIFRLFPTYIVALSIICLISLLYGFLAHTHFPFSSRELISTFFLYDFSLPKGFVDPVVWTLRVEVGFYLVVAFVAAVSSLRSFNALMCTTLTLAVVGSQTLMGWGWLTWLSTVMVGSVGSLVFMFIGTAFYNYYKNYWDLAKFMITSVILYLLFLAVVSANQTVIFIQSYTLGLAIFGLSFACRNMLRKNRVLDWFAEISYPLYLLHCVAGTIFMSIVFTLVPNPLICTLLSLSVVFIVCHILHVAVEAPGIKLGKFLTKSWKKGSDFGHYVAGGRHGVPLPINLATEAQGTPVAIAHAQVDSAGRVSPGLIVVMLFLSVNIYLQCLGQGQLLSFIAKTGRHMPEKVQLYVESAKTPDVLLMGSSRGVLGLNPWVIEEVLQKHGLSITALNISIAASSVDLNYLILKNFVLDSKKPKVIVYALSEFDILGLYPPDNHYRSLLRLPYSNLLAHVDDCQLFATGDVSKRLNFIGEQFFPAYRDRCLIKDAFAFVFPDFSQFLSFQAGRSDIKGFNSTDVAQSQKQIEANDAGYRNIEPKYNVNNPYFGDLDLFVSLARKHGIDVVLVNMPVSNQFRSYWKDDKKVDQYCALVDEYARAQHIPLLNIYKGISRYCQPEVEFMDSNHLLRSGSERVSKLIATRYLLPLFDNSKIIQNPIERGILPKENTLCVTPHPGL